MLSSAERTDGPLAEGLPGTARLMADTGHAETICCQFTKHHRQKVDQRQLIVTLKISRLHLHPAQKRLVGSAVKHAIDASQTAGLLCEKVTPALA
jgi:hypothetical protein